MTIHPQLNSYTNEVLELDSDVEDYSFGYTNTYVPTFIKRIRNNEGTTDVKLKVSENLMFDYNSLYNIGDPGFNLDVTKMKVVKFTSDLLINLNLLVTYKGNFGNARTCEFDDSISYDKEQKRLFRHRIIDRNGYLLEESNYFNVEKNRLSKGTKVTSLRNSRVILFWRGINLEYVTVKRILSLGLTFLIGELSYAELLYLIKSIIPEGVYEVTIKHKTNTFVLIGIEEPVFTF